MHHNITQHRHAFALSVPEYYTERADGLVLCTPWYRCELAPNVNTSHCPCHRLSVVEHPQWAKFLCENRMAIWLQPYSPRIELEEWNLLFDDHFDERVLELCRDRSGEINLLSLLTITRYVRTRSKRMLTANVKFLNFCREIMRPDSKIGTEYAQLILTQNLYVTEHCQRALMRCKAPSEKLKNFMAAEVGHDAILRRGLGFSTATTGCAPLPAVKALMQILAEAADHGEQPLAFMIDVFESASIQPEQHPLIPLMADLPNGERFAAALRQHARINSHGQHDLVAFSLLQDCPHATLEMACRILDFERRIHQTRLDLLAQCLPSF